MRLWYAALWLLLVLATPPATLLLLVGWLFDWAAGVEAYLTVVIARGYCGGRAFPDPEPKETR